MMLILEEMIILNKLNKGIVLIMILLLTASVFLSGCNESKVEAAAKVNGEVISKSELDKYVDYRKKEAELSGYISQDMWETETAEGMTYEEQLTESSLQDLVNQEVLLQEAEELDIEVKDKDVEEELKQYKDTDENEEKFNEYLESMGISEEYFEEMYKKGMIITALIEKIVDISDETAKEEYEQNKEMYDKVQASHILVKTEEEAKEIKEKIEGGEDFAELAKEYGTDGTAANGGDLGFFVKSQMVTEFSEAAFELEKGEVSDIVETKHGFHLIKLTDKKLGFEANKDEIIANLQNVEFNEKAQELIDEADVEILIDFEKEDKKDEAEDKKDEEKTTDDGENEDTTETEETPESEDTEE